MICRLTNAGLEHHVLRLYGLSLGCPFITVSAVLDWKRMADYGIDRIGLLTREVAAKNGDKFSSRCVFEKYEMTVQYAETSQHTQTFGSCQNNNCLCKHKLYLCRNGRNILLPTEQQRREIQTWWPFQASLKIWLVHSEARVIPSTLRNTCSVDRGELSDCTELLMRMVTYAIRIKPRLWDVRHETASERSPMPTSEETKMFELWV